MPEEIRPSGLPSDSMPLVEAGKSSMCGMSLTSPQSDQNSSSRLTLALGMLIGGFLFWTSASASESTLESSSDYSSIAADLTV